MDPETSCLSCYGTGSILAPHDSRPDYPAHPYQIVCGCGILLDRYPMLNYRTGQTMPWTTHRQVLARTAGCVAWVDELLHEDIENLWMADIGTSSSCQDSSGKFILIRDKTRVAAARDLLPWVTLAEDSVVGSGAVLRERVLGEE